MIEKLKTINPCDETEIDMDTNSVAGLVYENTPLIQKLNELCDAVNSIISVQEKLIDSRFVVETKHETPAKNVQDKHAEQRKWIGKLCKFWDIDNNNLYYGPLTKIHDTSPYCYECNHKMCYAFCEPVKDDIIYKGGVNE